MASDFTPEESAQYARLTAKQEAIVNATKSKDPEEIAAEENLRKQEEETEKARIRLAFQKIGPVGDIANQETQENARFVIKNLQSMEYLLAGQNEAIASKWFKNKENAAFIEQAEDAFCHLSDSIVKLLHPLDLGGYQQEAAASIGSFQEASNKRQRIAEEKAQTPVRKARGCTCGARTSDRQAGRPPDKCRTRCPCDKAGYPCNEHCKCTVENCQNTAGLPPPRPERRGRPRVQQPTTGYMPSSFHPDSTTEATQRFPQGRRTSHSERSYRGSDSDSDGGSPEGQRQYRTKQTARAPTQVCSFFACFS